MLTPREKSLLPEIQRRVEPATLHHAGQRAQHTTDWTIPAPCPCWKRHPAHAHVCRYQHIRKSRFLTAFRSTGASLAQMTYCCLTRGLNMPTVGRTDMVKFVLSAVTKREAGGGGGGGGVSRAYLVLFTNEAGRGGGMGRRGEIWGGEAHHFPEMIH